MFQTTTLSVFWIKIKAEYSATAKKKAQNALLQFTTSYLCEVRFSAVTVTKNQINWT